MRPWVQLGQHQQARSNREHARALFVRFFSHALFPAMGSRALSNLLAIARVGVASTSGAPGPSAVRIAPPPSCRPAGASEPAFRPRGQVALRAGRTPPGARVASASALELLLNEEAEDEGVGLVDPAVDRDVERPTPRWYANSGKAHTYEVSLLATAATATALHSPPSPPFRTCGRTPMAPPSYRR